MALAGVGVGLVCLAKFALYLACGLPRDNGAGFGGLALMLVGVYIWRVAQRGRFRVGALAVAAMALVLMLSVKGVLTPGNVMVPAYQLGKEVLAKLPPSTPVASVGVPDHASALLLLGSGRKIDRWANTKNLARQREVFDEFMAGPGPRVAVISGSLFRGLPPVTLAKYEILGSRSAVKALKVKKWLKSGDRTLRSLIEGSKVNLHALLKPGPGESSRPPGTAPSGGGT